MTPARLLAALLLLASAAGAQEKFDPRLRGMVARGAQAGGVRLQGALVEGPSPAVRLFVRLAPGADLAGLRARFPAATFEDPAGPVLTGLVPVSDLGALANDPAVASAESAHQLRLTNDVVRTSYNVAGVWVGALDAVSIDFGTILGSGVVAGFVDSGIDFKHPDFYTEGAPNQTRILSIWDQTISSHAGGPFPSGFTYGAEYSRAQVDAELTGSPPGVIRELDTNGHGTHVAGIVAGDGSATANGVPAGTYKGLAPEADIVMVKSNLADADVLNGLQYIIAKAAAAGKRAVINLSIGGQYGPHDGTSSFETGAANVAASTPVVIAAGNEQADSAHASATIATNVTFPITVQSGQALLGVDLWGAAGDTYTVVVTNTGTGATATCAVGQQCLGQNVNGNSVDIYDNTTNHPNRDPEVYVEIFRSGGLSALGWTVKLTKTASGGTGRVDGWITTLSAAFTSLVDLSRTVGPPATANNVIAVGSYCSRNSWTAFDGATYSNSPSCTPGDASEFSNRGPTRDGRQKPDLSAPGQRIASTLSADQSPAPAANIKTVDGKHKLISGTSMATPVVAGSIVRMLQRTPAVTAAAVKTTLQGQARTDTTVTSYGAPPNTVFGYGKLDILGCGDQLVVAPAAADPLTLGTSSISWTWAALSGATSYKVYYASNPASLIASPALPALTMTGLAANTTISIRVTGVSTCGEGPGQNSASTSTLAVPLGSIAATAFVSSAAVTWAALPAAPRSASSFGYRVDASTVPTFTGAVLSSATGVVAVTTLTVSNLTSFVTYYFRVGTLNAGTGPNYGTASAFAFTQTTLVPPGPGGFSDITESVIRASWTLNGNPPGLQYVADASTDANFAGTLFSSSTLGLGISLAGLAVDTTYYFRVRPTTGPYANIGSTATLGAVPTLGAPPFTAVFQTSMTAAWNPGANLPGTPYQADLSPVSDFSLSLQSSVTVATSAVFSGLLKNATYYLRVASINLNSSRSAFGANAATSTLTLAPTTAAAPFSLVGPSSVTVNWTALPGLSPPYDSCEGYRVQAATSADFTGTARFEALTANAAAGSLSVTGLLQSVTYFFRVGALNNNGVGVFTDVGSTLTVGALISSTTVQPGERVLITVNPSVPQLAAVLVDVPAGTFPAGTVITIDATALGNLPSVSGEGRVTLLGSSAGVDISAGGLQPAAGHPVTVRFTYVPANLPAGSDPRRIVMGRFAGGGWTLLPTTLDKANNTVTAQTSHFTLFAPLLVTAATTLDAVQVFPIPWKPGSNDPLFDAQSVSFTNLPDGAEVRIFTVLGEEVAALSAGPTGIVLWDGRNKNGRRAGSGTYLVLLSGAGARRVMRVAVVR